MAHSILIADLSRQFGVPKEDIILESESMSTFDEAKFIKPIVKTERFLLITSASHMRRSMALFRKLGMQPIAAPIGHLVKRIGDGISFLPGARNLLKSDTIIWETLAYIKERLLGRI